MIMKIKVIVYNSIIHTLKDIDSYSNKIILLPEADDDYVKISVCVI